MAKYCSYGEQPFSPVFSDFSDFGGNMSGGLRVEVVCRFLLYAVST